MDAIKKDMIVFGLGPAGTGKTYLAMAMAISAFKNNEVGRIILTRPAIEAGEKPGFLPGDLQSKIDPYLQPLYDALYQIMGAESFVKNSEKGLIEVVHCLWREDVLGSKVVITGDETQKDLPSGQTSGLDVAVKVVNGLEGISVCRLTSRDVVRHPLVQKIVKAYENYEKKEESGKRGNRRKSIRHRG